MEMDKNYDSNVHAQLILKKIHDKLGDGVDPSEEEVLLTWRNMCKYKAPRMFMYIVDLKKNKTILSDGMSLLGYEDNRTFSVEEIVEMTHQNQRRLLQYQTLKVYATFFENTELSYKKGTVYCSHRALRDAHGEYWLVHQASTPIQYDAKGVMTKYLSTYRIIGKYTGDALETEIYTDPKYPEAQRELRSLMKKIKTNMLEGLGFSKTQEQIIEYSAIEDLDSNGIAKLLKIRKKTLANHRKAILDHARIIFPVNNFKEAQNVVEYLKKQSIL